MEKVNYNGNRSAKLMALKVYSVFDTTSYESVLVVAGMIPVNILTKK